MTPYTYISSLTSLLGEIPPDSILSRTFYNGDEMKAILFGFAAGQELSEHTAARPAVLHFLSGEARLKLGEDEMEAQPGTWVHMPAKLPHSIYAKTEVAMVLLLV
ncbi:MAG TPA: cupin domain-containing protein [Anaerolineales bacterium]|jgi:quercetin dioxygenase-like cupin family protein|nr:cupin domain-containing protein [Anaerolineales bacterium]